MRRLVYFFGNECSLIIQLSKCAFRRKMAESSSSVLFEAKMERAWLDVLFRARMAETWVGVLFAERMVVGRVSKQVSNVRIRRLHFCQQLTDF